jgi:hypothetical protein
MIDGLRVVSRVARSADDGPRFHDSSLIRVGGIEPIGLLGVGKLPLRNLDEVVISHVSHRMTTSHPDSSGRAAIAR